MGRREKVRKRNGIDDSYELEEELEEIVEEPSENNGPYIAKGLVAMVSIVFVTFSLRNKKIK